MLARHLGHTLLALSLLSACDAGDKAAEDAPLSDGKLDSFFSPTDHGTFGFGAPSLADITDDERFHSWTFELGADARVELETLDSDVDTVMYLYRRDLGSTGTWGRFLKKNDDHGGDILSRIALSARAGQYRIVVKAHKSAMRGPFALAGSCDGDGCPPPSTCVADEFEAQPVDTRLTAACLGEVVATLAAPITSHAEVGADEADLCSLGALELEVDRLRAYWDDLMGWEDFSGGDPLAYTVENDVRARGRTSLVDTEEFDEDAITFIYDGADQLIGLFQHNQSPDVRWFCAAGAPAIDEPSCVEDLVRDLPHRATDELTRTATASCASPGGLGKLAAAALCDFADAHGLAASAAIATSLTDWADADVGRIDLTAGAASATYYVSDSFGEVTILAIREGDVTTAPCRAAP